MSNKAAVEINTDWIQDTTKILSATIHISSLTSKQCDSVRYQCIMIPKDKKMSKEKEYRALASGIVEAIGTCARNMLQDRRSNTK